MDKGLLLVIIGGLLSCTIYGVLIGAPLTLIGAYLLYKKLKNPNKEIEEELSKKQAELDRIDEKLKQMEADKEAEIKQKLKEKQNELDNIQQTLDKLEAEKTVEIEEKLKSRKEDLDNIDEEYEKIAKEKESELDASLASKRKEEMNLKYEIKKLKDELVFTTDEVNLQSFGLYEPKYPFMDSTAYKEKLDDIRKQQKQMIKNKTATTDNPRMTLDGDLKKGQAMIRDTIKQILRNFNVECENVINKVNHKNYENSKKRIRKSYEQLNKLNKHLGVNIKPQYLNLKLEELQLAYDYAIKKEEEKEILKEAR